MTYGKRIGANLLRYMIANELSQGEVALRSGLTQPVISGLVTGSTKDPPISTLLKLATLPDLPLELLLKGVTAKIGARGVRRSQDARLKQMLDNLERDT